MELRELMMLYKEYYCQIFLFYANEERFSGGMLL